MRTLVLDFTLCPSYRFAEVLVYSRCGEESHEALARPGGDVR